MKNLQGFAASARKALVAAVGFVAEAVNAGLVHGNAAKWAAALIAAATAAGVYGVPNKPAAKPPA